MVVVPLDTINPSAQITAVVLSSMACNASGVSVLGTRHPAVICWQSLYSWINTSSTLFLMMPPQDWVELGWQVEGAVGAAPTFSYSGDEGLLRRPGHFFGPPGPCDGLRLLACGWIWRIHAGPQQYPGMTRVQSSLMHWGGSYSFVFSSPWSTNRRGSCPEFAKISNPLYDPKKCSYVFNLLTWWWL
jgi:hypothetical protein